jgi:glycosyltransferase involved in cell wall biosynthesis
MKKKVEYKVEKGNYDSLLLFEMSAIQYCPVTSFQKLIVNIEDPQSLKIFRMAELPIWSKIQKVKLFVLAKLMAFYENGMLPKVAKVIVLSKNDKNDMGNNGSLTNLACVTYGVEQRDCSEIIGYQGRDKVIIFSGSMYHPPNVDGALFFLNNIFPLVLEVNPTAKFQIVGAEPDSRIYKAAARFGQRVEITGRVNSVSMYIKRAAVSVCPVRLKIGVQTKILEALSWGTPTVSTSAGNSGIGGLSGTHLWIEDDARMFAKRVCDLLHGIEWEKLSLEGRKLVADSFTWEASTAQLEQHIVSVTSKCR